MDLSPNITLAQYRIISKLGAGGMGEVYLAQDTKLDRKVALKVLPADVASHRDRMGRFIREAKSAAALNHPNIATVYDIGESGLGGGSPKDGSAQVHFIAMEFIDGRTLREEIHRERTPLLKLLKYLQQVAEGLAKAHAVGIVHRDLKPDNIMITADGHAKILDFGLAKLVDPQPTADSSEVATAMMPQHSAPGAIMGTVGYMSPEQAKAKPVDQRSDIFSFGCVLYEAATGHKPFVGDSMVETLYKIINEPAPPITDNNPHAPAELQRTIRKCLAKEPEKRYQSIRETANDLEEVIEELKGSSDIDRSVVPSTPVSTATVGKAESTHSVSSAEYVVSSIKSHKLGVAMVALVLLALIGSGYWYWRGRSPASNQITSIAVLPFQNRSDDPDTEYLSDGLAESLIFRLSQLPGLKVSPTSSVMHYKGKETDITKIANELGVDSVMTGRLVKRGDNLNITVELVDTRNNKSLWGEQYERKMSDLLTTQREIASAITQKLQLKLAGEERGLTKKYTDNNEAYQLYLKGRFYWNKRNEENLKKAIEQFKAASDKDPNYALAYVGLADCYAILPYYTSASADFLAQAKAYAERALSIDDSLGEAHASLGIVHRASWNWTEALKELRRAIELNPNYATAHKQYGNVLDDLGRTEESIVEYKKAQELEPLSLIISINLAETYLRRGDVTAAVQQCQRAIDLDPNWYYAHQQLGLTYLKQGLNAEALAEAEKGVEMSKGFSVPLGNLGYVYSQMGKRQEALAVIEELKGKYEKQQANGYDIARTYVGLGENDLAFEWLEKDFRSHNPTMPSFLSSPPLDALRDDPRMKDLVRRIGLPE